MRPSSSTSSVTVSPAYPVCVTTDVDHQRRALQRRARRRRRDRPGCPRERLAPDADGEDRNAPRPSARAAHRSATHRVVSAPSLTSDEAGERQSGQLLRGRRRAPRRAGLRARKRQLVGARAADADDEKRNVRRTNRSDSALSSAASGEPNCCRDEVAARLRRPSRRSACCASRPSARQEVLLRHRGLDDEHGPEQAEQDDASAARRSPASTMRSRTRPPTPSRGTSGWSPRSPPPPPRPRRTNRSTERAGTPPAGK